MHGVCVAGRCSWQAEWHAIVAEGWHISIPGFDRTQWHANGCSCRVALGMWRRGLSVWSSTARPPGACGVAGAAAWPAAGARAQALGQRAGQRLHSAQQRRGACPAEVWPASSPEGHCRQAGETDGAAVAHRGSQRWHAQHLTEMRRDHMRVAGTGLQAEQRDSTPIEAEARAWLGTSWGVCQGVGQDGWACRAQH